MSIIFSWKINSLEVQKESDMLKNIILTVNWTLRGTDSDNSSIFVEESGINRLSPPNENNFKPFEQITEAELISWLEASFIEYRYFTNKQNPEGPPLCIDENHLEFAKRRIEVAIEEIKNPRIVTMLPPWLSGSI